MNAYEKAQLDSKTAKDISESAEAAVKAAKVDLIERRKNAAEQTVGLQSAIAIFWSAAKDQLKADPDVKKSGVTERELQKAKNGLRIGIINRYKTNQGRAGLLVFLSWSVGVPFACEPKRQ